MWMRLFVCFLLVAVRTTISAQQVPDVDYNPPIFRPAYKIGTGPKVIVDDTHHNFHTAEGRYRPFAQLLRRDGYRVNGLGANLSRDSLQNVDVLVIVNALNERNENDWSLPTPSAFSCTEIKAVRCWVQCGGSLLLIADHMPFPGAAAEMARAFCVEFSNGYARPGHRQPDTTDTFERQTGLCPSEITFGRNTEERVTRVATFGGSAFKPPIGATPVLVFGPDSLSLETTKAPGITPDAARVPIDGWCQGAVFPFCRGRVAVFGEAAMFTAQLAGDGSRPMGMNAPGAEQNYQLALNVMHWLTRANQCIAPLTYQDVGVVFDSDELAGNYSLHAQAEAQSEPDVRGTSLSHRLKPFNADSDVISLHYDHADDKDDGHSAAADRSLLQTMFSKKWIEKHAIPVSGAYGTNRDIFVSDSDRVMEATWNDCGGWLSAHNDWNSVVDELAKRWSSALNSGGDVWIKEGGQSDLTAQVVRKIKRQHPALQTTKRIHLIQHSRWNENKTTERDLNYVKANTHYIKIPDANRYLRVDGGDANFVAAAINHSEYGKFWRAAFEYYDPKTRLDFSDTGELLHILGIGEKGIEAFQKKYLQPTRGLDSR